ncbi:MAG: hypothetical protein PHR00_00490 [Patescibacteria group bacterium]|nr:hypothetical protein [Patescibacteria group bacterium]
MKKYFFKLLSLLPVIGLIVSAPVSFALTNDLLHQDVLDKMDEESMRLAEQGYSPDTTEDTLMEYIANVINVFLGLLATIFVILIVYAGYNWMTAHGEKAKIDKAQNIIRAAIIGLIITVAAFAITWWVFARMPDNQVR